MTTQPPTEIVAVTPDQARALLGSVSGRPDASAVHPASDPMSERELNDRLLARLHAAALRRAARELRDAAGAIDHEVAKSMGRNTVQALIHRAEALEAEAEGLGVGDAVEDGR